MMKILSGLLVFILYINVASGQTTDDKVSEKIEALQKQGIDTLVRIDISDTTQFNKVVPDTACVSANTSYLAWISKSITYLQRFDDCFNYQPHQRLMDNFFRIALEKFKRIKGEEIKPPVFSKSSYTSLRKKEVNETTAYIDGHSYTEFTFLLGKQKVHKAINNYYLDRKYLTMLGPNAEGLKNESDEYNNSTTLKKLKDLFEKQISQLKDVVIR